MKIKMLMLASLFLLNNPANALIITDADVGTSFTVDWFVDLNVADNGTDLDLSGASTWTVSSFNDAGLVLDIGITNTTVTDSVLTEAAIVSFAFAIDPTATATLTDAGTIFDSISDSPLNFPGGYEVDICLYSGNNCQGGSVNDGLAADGAMGSLQITLLGDFAVGDTDFSAEMLFFPAKFQTTVGSFEPEGCVNCTEVPEPSVVALLAIGLLGVVAARRRMHI